MLRWGFLNIREQCLYRNVQYMLQIKSVLKKALVYAVKSCNGNLEMFTQRGNRRKFSADMVI